MLKPDDEMNHIISRDRRVGRLAALFDLPSGTMGCTGSLLCGLESSASDIDLVVYGKDWFRAQALLQALIGQGTLQDISEETWQTIYRKRNPEISYEQFMRHEVRKWNRGEIEGTYFDLLYTRGYKDLPVSSAGQGRVLGRERIEALVTDASLSFDNPAVYEVEHDHITRVLSFTHTYSGQALAGEVIEAAGVREAHPGGDWLVIGTTREARGEYILSKTLLES